MTTYYVRKSGNDSNDGLSSGSAWATIGKALGAAGISSGDTVYIGAGVYRELVTISMTSPTIDTSIIGDVYGAQTGDAGEIRITNYLTNDKTAPTDSAALINLNGRNFLTFKNLSFVNASSWSSIDGSSPLNCHDISILDCSFINLDISGSVTTAIALGSDIIQSSNYLIDRCRFLAMQAQSSRCIFIGFGWDLGGDAYDVNVTIRNCTAVTIGRWLRIVGVGALSSAPVGGVHIQNCTVISGGGPAVEFVAFLFSDFPSDISNCIIAADDSNGCIVSFEDLSTAITEDYNVLFSLFPTWQVGSGGHSISNGSYAPLLHIGQELMQGLMSRPLGMPTTDSPLLGFGDDGNAPSVDILNRPRPAGGQSSLKAVGAYERHDTGAKEITVVDSSPASVKIVGPGDHDFYIPVDAMSTTISVKARYDTNHGAGNKPQAVLLAAPEIDVSAETKTMTSGVDTWETLTFTPFTPAEKGVVKVRLISRSAAGDGIAYFDTVNVA